MGRTLVVNKASIACVLGIPDEGECNEDQPFPDTIKTIKNQAAYLSFEDRILHFFISHVLRPFGIKYSTIRDIDYWWLYMLRNKKKPNLAWFILNDLLRVVQGKEKTLVIGMVISFYLEEIGIDVSCDARVPLSKFAMIKIQTLHKMRYYQNQQSGQWEKRHEAQIVAQEGGQAEEGANVPEVGGSSSQAFNIEETFQSIMSKLTAIELEQAQFREFVTQRFDDIDERQAAMYDEIQISGQCNKIWKTVSLDRDLLM